MTVGIVGTVVADNTGWSHEPHKADARVRRAVGIAVDIDAVAVNITIRADATSTTVPTHDRRKIRK